MVLKADQLRVKALLAETVTLLCKNGLHFKSKFSIEGLIGITLDDEDIFLVSINETIQATEPSEEYDDCYNEPEPLPLPVKRKFRGVSSKPSPQITEDPESPTTKSMDAGSCVPTNPPICHPHSLRSGSHSSPLSVPLKPTNINRFPRTAEASPGVGTFSSSNDSETEFGNDSLPASSAGPLECENVTFPTVSIKSDPAADDQTYDGGNTLLPKADLDEQPNKRIRLGSSEVPADTSMLASAFPSGMKMSFAGAKEMPKSDHKNVIEIKEESLSDGEPPQLPNYSGYEDYSNVEAYGGPNTEMMQGFADSSMFQAGGSFFVPQPGDGIHNPDVAQLTSETKGTARSELAKKLNERIRLLQKRRKQRERLRSMVKNLETTEVQIQLVDQDIKRLKVESGTIVLGYDPAAIGPVRPAEVLEFNTGH